MEVAMTMTGILALDQGTTSSRAIFFDGDGNKIAQAQRPLAQVFPRPGWVEHDPRTIWDDQLAVAYEVMGLADLVPRQIDAIGIANQRETVVVWDRATGEPLYNAIVWQDRRTAASCEDLVAAGHEPMVRERTGLSIDPYFSATKIAWILDSVEGSRARADAGELACGTIDSWITWNLTAGKVHITDVTNASRTLLLDIATGAWDPELLELFRVPASLLPEVVSSSGVVGKTEASLFGWPIRIAAVCGDQQASLAGNGGFSAGDTKATFGTGIFVLTYTGEHRPRSEHLAVTLAARIGDERLTCALEGSIFMGGAIVQWLVEELHLADSPSALEELARTVPDSGGVVLVPALTGLGAPEWDPYARGAVFGLTRGATSAHLARAALESIPLQVGDLTDVMVAESGNPLRALRVDGGVTANRLVMQTLADLQGVPVHTAAVAESTALGAAYLAGRAIGTWGGPADLPALRAVGVTYEPDPAQSERLATLRGLWAEGVRRSLRWAHD
jgi:glycerol kinase